MTLLLVTFVRKWTGCLRGAKSLGKIPLSPPLRKGEIGKDNGGGGEWSGIETDDDGRPSG